MSKKSSPIGHRPIRARTGAQIVADEKQAAAAAKKLAAVKASAANKSAGGKK